MLMMITYGLGFIVIPIDVSFVFGKKRAENLLIWEITSAIDVAINFLSCYQDQQTKRIVLDGPKIAKHYIRNYFWIDVLSSIPDRLILMWFFSADDLIYGNDIHECFDTSKNSSGSCFWDIVSILSLLKIVQLPLFFKYLTNYLEDQHKRSGFTIKIIKMTVGIVFTLIGFALHIWLVSEAYMYLTTSFGPCLGFQEIRYQLRAYIAFKHIPKSIQSRILSYYDFNFKDKFYSQEQILILLGVELRQSIAIEICQEHLWKNYLFKILPENLLKSIASCMVEETYLQNDIISRNDYNGGQKLYYIVLGTVAVYTQEGNETAHLYDGNMFGEMEFLQYRESMTYMNYVAAEECKILVLQRTDFMRIMAENTEYINQMRMLLSEQNFNEITNDNTNEGSSSNITKKVII
ncbi:potassium/sodium hyperpolarization-activated cyclic nucleotide-gated channel 4-like [Chironomus tepperi]|uniref:potassium/sodium hyperpolarization-activated cyclic nucleotide-gated channel 4-like n=1 Tax=Chironomus tepperi TaxID=113505 RepID=UPI00391FA50D